MSLGLLSFLLHGYVGLRLASSLPLAGALR